MAEIVIRPLDLVTLRNRVALAEFIGHRRGKAGLGLGQHDPILRPLGPSERGCNLAEVERKGIGIHGLGR